MLGLLIYLPFFILLFKVSVPALSAYVLRSMLTLCVWFYLLSMFKLNILGRLWGFLTHLWGCNAVFIMLMFCFCRFLLDQGVNCTSNVFFVPLNRGVFTLIYVECIIDSVVWRFSAERRVIRLYTTGYLSKIVLFLCL